MNAVEAEVLGVITGIVILDGCLILWGPLPWGLGLRRPRWTRHFWLYPRSLRLRGIV